MLAAAAMQDPRVQAAFPGGVIWLRAGHSAAGRLLRMMELAVCQVTKLCSRTIQLKLAELSEIAVVLRAIGRYLLT